MAFTWDVPAEDRATIRAWFATWGTQVADVDFAPAKALFEDNIASFGTHMDVVEGLDHLADRQWRSVWPAIEDFRWNLETLKVGVSPDRLFAIGIVTFASTGLHADGSRFDRPGRATVAFARSSTDDPWKGVHTHVSLNPGTPSPSHGKRPAKS
ncbi:MAG: nuclear transport factor 2 family protein [Alphaproteobacteria bacterium]|nr:nuclear transport factor 2 family protein [Alphaproteobacteria bacterium]